MDKKKLTLLETIKAIKCELDFVLPTYLTEAERNIRAYVTEALANYKEEKC